MTKHITSFLVGILLACTVASLALAQAAGVAPAPIRVEFVYSKYDASGTLLSPSHMVGLTTAASGKFSVGEYLPVSFPPACTPAIAANATAQRGGIQVEGTMSPTPDGRFQINFVITDRSVAGCRMVGVMNIPVFANRISNKDAVVAFRETVPLTIDKSNGETVKIEVRLAPER